MKTKEEIIDEAKASYSGTFKEPNAIKTQGENPEDFMIDREKVEHIIVEELNEEKQRHESLQVLKEHLEEEAKESLEKVLPKETREGHIYEKTVEDVEKELKEEKEKELKKFQELKEREMHK